MSTLSVCVVTKNEEHNIALCLESVSFADEIIVVDSFSTDNTVAIAKTYTDKVTQAPYLGCGPQKLRAVALAKQEWVLILDADEQVSPQLATEIQQFIRQDKYGALEIRFQSFFLGKAISFGDWHREYHLRLFKRTSAEIVPRLVHFGINLQGSSKRSVNKILHYSYPNLDTVLKKINAYSTLGAQQLFNDGKKISNLNAIGHAVAAFVRGFIIKFGFLDGKHGYMLAIMNAQCTYYKYMKLIELRNGAAVVQ